MNILVINFKKYILTFLLILFTISLLLYSETNIVAAQNGFILWATKVLPSLFPFFVATELLCRSNFTYILGNFLNKFMKPIFNVSGEGSLALILGTTSGYPIGAKVICTLKKEKKISKIEAERLIAYSNNSNPLFILSTVGISIFNNKKLGYILLASHILSSLAVGFCFKYWKKNKYDLSYKEEKFNMQNSPIKIHEFGELLGNSIKQSISSLLSICGFIVLFSILLSMLQNNGFINLLTSIFLKFGIPESISSATITGIIELTNGVYLAASFFNNFPIICILITSFLLGFGGISILLQIYSIIAKENISIKPYFYGKLLHGILSMFFTYLLI